MQDARRHARCGSERPAGTHQLEGRSMDRERHEDGPGAADWSFAAGDPHDLPTDRLPDRAEFDRYATPLLARRDAGPAMPPGENETVDLSSLDIEHPDADPARGSDAEPAAATGAIPVLGPDGDPVPAAPDDEEALVAPLSRPGAVSYARSGTTPNAEDEDETPWYGFVPLHRFRALGVLAALRDVAAPICLAAALTTTFTLARTPRPYLLGKFGLGPALLALVAVHLLRWVPSPPPRGAVRLLRFIGMLPALATAVTVVVVDLVLSLPKL